MAKSSAAAAAPGDTPSCTIMTLPEGMRVEAARRAIEHFPANSPLHGTGLDAGMLRPQQIAGLTSKFWGPRVTELSVQFLDNPTQAFRRMLLEAANSWDCRVVFRETATDGQVRLSRNKTGYYSFLGQDILLVPSARETMNLQGFTERTDPAEWLRVPPHEFGHTLGFVHEQLRPEVVADILVAETIAAYRVEQGWDEATTRANVLTGLDARLLTATPVDQDSIMAYWIRESLTRSGRGFRGGLRLNASDLDLADRVYPKPIPDPPVTPPPPVKPPEPGPAVEEFGPYPLQIGVPSDRFTHLAGTAILFRFKVRANRVFIGTTQGKIDLTMDLLDSTRKVLRHDDDSGLNGNPLVHAPLKPGTYFLRVGGDGVGPFRVKVSAA